MLEKLSLMKGTRISVVLFALLATSFVATAALPTNPILFVTQPPIPNEVNDGTVSNVFVSVVSSLGNHLADTAHAGRGGDLWIRYTDGTLRNLTRAAGYGVNGPQHGVGIAVRDPHVHWNGARALFRRAAGAPPGPGLPQPFRWQLFEITNFLNPAAVPVVTLVSNQPANYNNTMPC